MIFEFRIRSLYAGSLTGFLLALLIMTISDFQHGVSFKDSVSDFGHFIIPLIVGVLVGLIAQFHWIKNRKHLYIKNKMVESETRFENLFDNMIDAVCIIDNDKRITDMNQSCLELFGYTRNEMLKMSLNDTIYKGDKDISDKYFKQLEREGSYSMYEGRAITKSGRIFWIQVNSKEIYQNGKRMGSLDIIRDISKRKEIEIKLEETIEQLQSSNTTKDKLYSIIAHDLRSPFNSIVGFSEILLEEYIADKKDDMEVGLRSINSSALETLFLLENLLNWANTQSGQLSFQPENIHVQSITQGAIDTLKTSAMIKNISLRNEVPGDIQVLADQNMLMIVFQNLISNAIKFTKENGLVEINAVVGTGQVEISVSDNGIGIDQGDLDNLFDTNAVKTTRGTNNERGSGLGLVLCKEMTERNMGKLWVKSKVGKGSIFTLALPMIDN